MEGNPHHLHPDILPFALFLLASPGFLESPKETSGNPMVAMVMKYHSHWDSQSVAFCWHFPHCHDQGGPEKSPCYHRLCLNTQGHP